jgi:uncharacterized membrane protein
MALQGVATKAFAMISTLLVVGFTAVFGLFVLLVALNGFSERDGGRGLTAYVVTAMLSVVGAVIATPFLAAKRQRTGRVTGAVMAWVYACLAGSLGLLIALTIGLIVASVSRG